MRALLALLGLCLGVVSGINVFKRMIFRNQLIVCLRPHCGRRALDGFFRDSKPRASRPGNKVNFVFFPIFWLRWQIGKRTSSLDWRLTIYGINDPAYSQFKYIYTTRYVAGEPGGVWTSEEAGPFMNKILIHLLWYFISGDRTTLEYFPIACSSWDLSCLLRLRSLDAESGC